MEDKYLFFTIKHGSECCHVYATLGEFLDRVPVSRYHPAPIREIINTCEFGESEYIIGPWYQESRGNDFQLAVTGKPNRNESREAGIIRELGEEIGATPKSVADLQCVHSSGKWTGWACNMASGMTLNTTTVPEIEVPDNPDRTKPVSCVVHTTEEQVFQICRDSGTLLWPSSDAIDGLVAVPIAAARQIVATREANAPHSAQNCALKTLCNPRDQLACQTVLMCDHPPVGAMTTQAWSGSSAVGLFPQPPGAVIVGNQTTSDPHGTGWEVVSTKKKKKKKKK
jgi:hypothetical protein